MLLFQEHRATRIFRTGSWALCAERQYTHYLHSHHLMDSTSQQFLAWHEYPWAQHHDDYAILPQRWLRQRWRRCFVLLAGRLYQSYYTSSACPAPFAMHSCYTSAGTAAVAMITVLLHPDFARPLFIIVERLHSFSYLNGMN